MTGQAMLDFNRSFLTFTTLDRGNNARIRIEARCTLAEHATGVSHRYVMIASCKAEDTYGDGSLFKQPNYDFSGVFSDSEYAIYRAFASASDNQPESGPLDQLFAEVVIAEVTIPTPRLLSEPDDIIRATLAGLPLCARTVFDIPGGSYTAILDYPIKTMNVNPERQIFQVDTGPLPFPEALSPAKRLVDLFRPAFVAYKSLERAEFILQGMLELPGGAMVNHFADIRTIPARTMIFAAE